MDQDIVDLVKYLVDRVEENETVEDVLNGMINNVVEQEENEQLEENLDEMIDQVGGSTLKVHKRDIKEIKEGRFKGAVTSVVLDVEIPRSMAAHPNGPEVFGDAVVHLIQENIPSNSSPDKIKAGVVFESEELFESVGLHLKEYKKIRGHDIVKSMEEMAQSNKNLLEMEVPRLSMKITYLTPPVGHGKRRYTHEKLLNEIAFEKKRRGLLPDDEDFEALHNNEDVVNESVGNDFIDGEAMEADEEDEEEDDQEEDEEIVDQDGKVIKRGNVMQNNVTKDCLPHALYQVFRFWLYKNNKNAQNRNNYLESLNKTDNKNRQKRVHDAVARMKELAGITKDSNFDFEDIDKFQKSFFDGKFQIIAFMDKMYTPYYKGPDVGKGKELYLSLEDQHYSGVRSLCALFKTKYYCALCETAYRSAKDHYNCKDLHRTCGKRNDDCPTSKDNVKTPCVDCGITFRSAICYKNHKQKGPRGGKSRCDYTYTCKKCNQYVYTNKNTNPHVCGDSYCHRCRQPREEGHQCPMMKSVKNEKRITKKRLYFDIESRADENGLQVPVLFVSLKCCPKCSAIIPKDIEDAKDLTCENCAPDGRLKIIESITKDYVDVAKEMTNYIFGPLHKGLVAVAHNGSGYDGQFILENLIASNKATPELSIDGTKVVYLKNKGVRMIDSLKYLTMSLGAVAKTFQIDSVKGDFPVKFIKPENYNYVGDLPDNEFYALENKSPTARKELEKFLNEERKTKKFNFVEEIHRYCYNDVYILASAMTNFESSFESMTEVVLLEESTTAASAAVTAYQRKHLEENTIILDAKPAAAGNASVKSQKYLAYIGHSENVQINISTTYGEQKIGEHRVDGFIPPCDKYKKGKIIEFYGCYYHAHSCKCSANDIIGDKSAKEIRIRDKRRERKLAKHHTIQVVWECEVDKMLSMDKEMAEFFENYEAKDLLHCEKALVGGRTEIFRLIADNNGKKLYYLDVVSLYPYVMKHRRFPVGPPEDVPRSSIPVPMTKPEDIQSNGESFDGFVKCRVIAPKGLKIPLLAGRIKKRLMFTLCNKCATSGSQDSCQHTDEERSFNGTFTTPELRKALSIGYVVTEIYHAIKYNKWLENDENGEGGLFTSYINQMMIEKIYSSGYPSHITTPEQKEEYRKSYEENEHIILNEPWRFVTNPGKRAVAKLMLNSLWGKFAQRVDRDEVKVIIKPRDFWRMMYDKSLTIIDIRSVNDCMVVKYRRQVETLQSLRTGAVHIAALVPSYGRLHLYSLMEKVGADNIIYSDTDSIVFSVPDGADNPLEKEMGSFLGQLTDEVVGEMIKFVTIAPKTYCYLEKMPDGQIKLVRKAKGITINSTVDKKYTLEMLETMVQEVMDKASDRTVAEFNQFTMKRDRQHRVYSQNISKKFRYTFNKRRVLSDGSTLPFGF